MTWKTDTIRCLIGITCGLYSEAAQAQVLSFLANEMVGRPTNDSAAIHAVMNKSVDAYVEYGTQSGNYPSNTSQTTFSDGIVRITITGLSADTQYFYRVRYRDHTLGGTWLVGAEKHFHTQRSTTSAFVFTVQSDSHQGYPAFYNSDLYRTTLQNESNDSPDLLFDLGDTVSTDGATESQPTVRQKYLNQRTLFDIPGGSAAVFLVPGNHENEEGWNLDDFVNQTSSLPVLGANARKRYFLNPTPNAFYTGNTDASAMAIDGDHLKGNYYAFQWGDALFVAIDPYWYTMTKPYAGSLGGEKDDEVVGTRWSWTLGAAQYQWLVQTLQNSAAKFKFVFAHQMTSVLADYGRGGALGAPFGEWGGKNLDGTWGLDSERPGWSSPIHQLLVDNQVTIFFHGHDHVFAKEVLDGVVYQECPMAANANYDGGFSTNPQDYAGGQLINNSGHLRVTVSPSAVTVAYVRAYLPGDGQNGTVATSYTITVP